MEKKKKEMANSKAKVGRLQAELIIKLEHLIRLESKELKKKRWSHIKRTQEPD